jgi:hypothetical protein
MQIKRKIVVQTLFVVIGLLAVGSNAFGDLINMTGGEQSLYQLIGYKDWSNNDITLDQKNVVAAYPNDDATLDVDIDLSDDYGFSVSSSLDSQFLGDQVSANGASNTAAQWIQTIPENPMDVHGGADSMFRLNFTTAGSSPVYFSVTGQLAISTVGYTDLHPEGTGAFVKLLSDGVVICETSLYGYDLTTSIPIDHGLTLNTGHNYILEAYAISGTHACGSACGHSDLHSRAASFSFTTTATVVPVPGAVILGSIGLAYSGLRLRRRKEL